MTLTDTPSPTTLMYMIIIAAVLIASLRWPVAPLAILLLFIAGLDLRAQYAVGGPHGSDVDNVTVAAIRRMLEGLSPYGHQYVESIPPGAPFPYGPVVLIWYLPFSDPSKVDLGLSILILFLLAVRGRPLGLAIYALFPVLLVIASDGSNDTSAGFLLLLAIVVIERWRLVGSALLGLAIGFKPYALAWVPPLIGWAGIVAVWPLAVTTLLIWGPALVLYGAGAILSSINGAEQVQLNVRPYYSLGTVLTRWGSPIAGPTLNTIRLIVAAMLSVVAVVRVRSFDAFVVGGMVIFLAALFLGYWSSFAYLSAIAPAFCWYVDRWFGHEDDRLDWRELVTSVGHRIEPAA